MTKIEINNAQHYGRAISALFETTRLLRKMATADHVDAHYVKFLEAHKENIRLALFAYDHRGV